MRCTVSRLLCGTLLFSASSFLLVFYLDLLPEHEVEFFPDYDEFEEEGLPSLQDRDSAKRKVFLPAEAPTDLPVIVWWTPFTPYERIKKVCPGGTCLITHSRTELTNPAVNVSAFLYYGSDFDLHDLPLPRRPHHLWALLHEESPKNNWVFATPAGISLFNVTSTVSHYSDYPLHLHFLHTLKHLLQPPRTPTHLKSKGDHALVIYLQSTCNPPSDRDSYVEELMKHISVDCLGRCLHNKDLPEHLHNPLTFGTEEVLDIVSKYKFALSFENALCHDYFTEKFWRPLYAGTVPVVRGSPTIRDWDPSGAKGGGKGGTHPSIIVADDFAGPKALAEFLKELDKNDTEYEQYLKYKKAGVTNKQLLQDLSSREWVVDGEGEGGNFIDGFECFLCDKLHERKRLWGDKASEQHPIVANTSHYHCLPPVPAVRGESQSVEERLLEMPLEARRDFQYWRWNSVCAKRRGVVASQLIGMGAEQAELSQALNTACHDVEY